MFVEVFLELLDLLVGDHEDSGGAEIGGDNLADGLVPS